MTVDVRLNAILDPERAGGRPLVDLARALVAGGATLVQLRDKHGSTRRMIEEARALVDVLAPFGVPLVINDRVDVALAAGAAGVHVGPDDMAVEDARAILGPGAIVGHSIKTLDAAERVPLDLLDYAGVGGVYATLSKDNPAPPMGPEGLGKIRAVLRRRAPTMPVVGIAGIEIGNAAPVVAAGADGVAVISALSLSPDPEVAARTLRTIVDGVLAERAA
ncbi:thiamine-phosphate diphosphorylase [Rhodoplanes elegans]|uniref:Thiamine-phosphate synthase n=1 Tax=Rhodoplanes elegans TaxID=29408 RepID=A0A327KSG2_9BRAD|nr:thiamine phosphate synthase [Rhodoplanes elegans]MBK5960557.1 thiamine-phosphate diphosphorylase [Rhodoplanes elegans]RAI41870.1 thiamine phosphate synthase [Rhodoplanes elegans]